MDEVAAKLHEVQVRIGKGIEWISTHDEGGRFHLWYKSGILPTSPMPAQPSHVREAYGEYHRARRMFEALEKQEAQLERQLGTAR